MDPRQLQRWRNGTKPSGDGLSALIKLAARIPGGFYTLFGVHVLPPAGAYQPPLAVEFALSGDDGEARRMRQAGDLDGALAVFAGADTARAETREARWAYAEWTDLVRRRFGDRGALVYSQGTGKAAALVPTGDGALEVAAVLGMRWEPGKLVSRRSLRGLRPLSGGA